MNMKLSLTLVVLLTIHQSSAQFPVFITRFIVNVREFTVPDVSIANFRCVGTVISNRHVLTTASCVKVGAGRALAIEAIATTGQTSVTFTEPVIRVSIHPDYVDGVDSVANVAVLLIPPRLTGTFRQRPRGQLIPDTECRLHGWGGEFAEARNESVLISSPQNCDPNFPQVFCTVFESSAHSSCSAYLGSPLLCGENGAVSGFVISDGGCTTVNGKIMLKYHDIGEFIDWISTSDAPSSELVNNARFMVVVGRYTTDLRILTNVCSAAIIHSRNVLTTANCVKNLERNQQVAVRTSAQSGRSDASQASSVTIHPTANIAIVRGGFFESEFFNISSVVPFPQSLPNWCFLYGFGVSRGNLRRDPIIVSPPTSCNPSNPDLHCSLLTSMTHGSCKAMRGSPIICGDEPQIAGILINDDGCELIDNRPRLTYVALSEYQEWISENSNNGVVITVSLFVILSLFLISFSLS